MKLLLKRQRGVEGLPLFEISDRQIPVPVQRFAPPEDAREDLGYPRTLRGRDCHNETPELISARDAPTSDTQETATDAEIDEFFGSMKGFLLGTRT